MQFGVCVLISGQALEIELSEFNRFVLAMIVTISKMTPVDHHEFDASTWWYTLHGLI